MAKGRAYPRRTPGKMNRTEERYDLDLELRELAGEILWRGFECWTFDVALGAKRCRFTPDFVVQLPDQTFELVDVKGMPTTDDALVKIKACAATYPFFRWVTERWCSKRKGWERREF